MRRRGIFRIKGLISSLAPFNHVRIGNAGCATAFTRILSGPSSLAREIVRPLTVNLFRRIYDTAGLAVFAHHGARGNNGSAALFFHVGNGMTMALKNTP